MAIQQITKKRIIKHDTENPNYNPDYKKPEPEVNGNLIADGQKSPYEEGKYYAKNEIGNLLGSRGKEFGTVTSRKRRCGWFDGVLVRQTIKISGIDGIALTKLDVLDELDEIKMCVSYELNKKKNRLFASSSRRSAKS